VALRDLQFAFTEHTLQWLWRELSIRTGGIEAILSAMNSSHEWPVSLRLVWLAGGLVAVNEPQSQDVEIKSSVIGQTLVAFKVNTYPSLFGAIKALGFRIVGTTFITDEKQFEGLRPPEFRAAGLQGGWDTNASWHSWRQIAFSANTQSDLLLLDVASRIAAGLKYSEMRLCDLAASYCGQLHSFLHSNPPKP
jgi:hypothetical protein